MFAGLIYGLSLSLRSNCDVLGPKQKLSLQIEFGSKQYKNSA